MIKKISLGLLAILLLVVGVLFYMNYPKLEIVSSYSAKKMCSCTFMGKRSQESIQEQDLAMFPLSLSKTEIDHEHKRVTTSVFGMHTKVAEYRDRLGCVLIHDGDDYHVKTPPKAIAYDTPTELFPYGDVVNISKTLGTDIQKVTDAAEALFDDNYQMTYKKTRAILIVHRDSIIYEQYADGYTKDTPMLGWSMTKSLMNTWAGILTKEGKISLDQKGLFSDWTDERKNISFKHLLNMTSGLEWQEVYDNISSATNMLYTSENNGAFAKNQLQEFDPGTDWKYSSGTSNILSLLYRNMYNDHADYLNFPYERIFGPLNMKNTTIETDESGTFIGSSYCYSTARDWARYGLFYLHDGVWNGERILPEGWVDFTQQKALPEVNVYGAQFWLNKECSFYPNAPHDLYNPSGFEGQRVFIIPSKDLVIVRMGLNGKVDFDSFLKEVCEAVGE